MRGTLDAEEQVSGFSVMSVSSAACGSPFRFFRRSVFDPIT
jgi:hypothetical protein